MTVAVKCHRDRRVFECLRSLPAEVEKLVLIAADDPLADEIRATGAHAIAVPENDIGVRCNAAIESASHDKIVLMDSDCIALPGSIPALEGALDAALVARARLTFRTGRVFWSRAIAGWREFENNWSPVPAFMPGLAIHRRILSVLEPPLFCPGLLFSVDDAFDARLKRTGVPVAFVPNAVIVHDVIGMQHFLKAGRRTGEGTARQVARGLRPNYEQWPWLLSSALRLRWLEEFKRWTSAAGTGPAFAGGVWYAAYLWGYCTQRRRDSRGRRE